MANDLIFHLVLANLAGAAAILAVLALRGPARAQLGAGMAYAFWSIVPAAMLATLFPARTVLLPAPVVTPDRAIPLMHGFIAASAMPHGVSKSAPVDIAQVLAGVWLAGVMISLILLAIGQRRALARFGRITADANDPRLARAANPGVGPALVGVLRPRVVVPNDFEARFEVNERAMIMAHERTHLAHGHTFINGLTALLKAVNWFNPLVHAAVRYARVDQELACDAAVIGRFPGARQTYAQALLKTQLAYMPLPLGCDWPARSPSLLEKRIQMLAQQKPGRVRLLGGAALIAALAAGAGLAAWSAEPADVRFAANSVHETISPRSSLTSAVTPLSGGGGAKTGLAPQAAMASASAAPAPGAEAAASEVAALAPTPAPGPTVQSPPPHAVDGITAEELQRRMRLLLFERDLQPTGQALSQIKMEAFSILVDEHLKLREVRRVQSLQTEDVQKNHSLIASESQIDDELADLAKKNSLTYDQMKAKFTAAGVDLNSLRDQVRIDISWQRLIGGMGKALPDVSAAAFSPTGG